MRILIADRQPAVRAAVRLLLQERLEPEVVAEAADHEEMLAQLASLGPDILVIEWGLPGWPADSRYDALYRVDHKPRVVVLGGDPESASAALAAGADAFVSMCDPPKRLLSAICTLSAEGQGA